MNQKIVKILNLKKQKNKYIINTSVGEITADEEAILKFYIFKDKEFTEEEYSEILAFVDVNKIFYQALNYISYQPRSIKEVEKYLAEKEVSKENIIAVIERLITMKYLDDELLAQGIINSMINNFKGPNYAKQKLIHRLVTQNIIERVLENYDKQLQKELIMETLPKLSKKYESEPINSQKTKIINKYLRDGFTSDVINPIVNSYQLIDDSEEKLTKDFMKAKKKYQGTDNEKNKIIASLIKKGYTYSQVSKKFSS